MYQPRIAISGAGPGGLTLARLLQIRNIPCTVFDLRPQPSPEEIKLPSGMLDLHDETGLAALRACGLEDDFKAALGDCSEATIVRNLAGQVLYTADDSGENNRPEIPRLSLIDLLVRSLPEGCIRWSTKLRGVSGQKKEDSSTEMILDLGDQGTFPADLVIGADGAWPKTRRYLSPVKPICTIRRKMVEPTRGEGVDSAMADALDLTNCLSAFEYKGDSAAEWQAGITDKIREYEGMMHQRAERVYADTDELLGIMHGENGAEALRDMFKSFEQGSQGEGPSPEMFKEG